MDYGEVKMLPMVVEYEMDYREVEASEIVEASEMEMPPMVVEFWGHLVLHNSPLSSDLT